VRSLNVGWYRKQLSYVEQEPTLFNMTIAENIAFGSEGVTRAEIEAAAIQVWFQCLPG
jgi:ATP-binding cassette, subfamily B (MDR/TAP), member 1